MKSSLISLLIFAFASLSSPAKASNIINFTGDDPTLSDNQFTNLTGTWVSGVYSHPYSDTNTVFTGDSGDGVPVLRGGVYATSSGTSIGAFSNLHGTSVSPDQLQIGWSPNQGPTLHTTFRYLFMAVDSDWLTLKNGASFDSLSSLSISTLTTMQTNINSINFVVKDDGLYYISASRLATTMSTLTLANPNAALWMQFDPSNINFGGIDPSQVSGAPHTFDNIEAVGLFIDGMSGSSVQPGTITLTNWTVNAAPQAIPEPSITSLLVASLGMAMCFGLRHQIRRKSQERPKLITY